MTKTTTTKTFYAAIDDTTSKVYNPLAWEIHVENWRHDELRRLQLKMRALDRLADSSYYRIHIARVLFESYITLHGNFDELRELPELPNMRLRRSIDGFPQYAVKCTDHQLAIKLFHDTIEVERAKTNRAIRDIDDAYPAYRIIKAVEAKIVDEDLTIESSGEPSDANMNSLISEMLNKLKKEAANTPNGKAKFLEALCRQSPAELLRKICMTDETPDETKDDTKPTTLDNDDLWI